MRYLFTNKKIKVGDVCIALCLKEHVDMLKLAQYFPNAYKSWKGIGRIGVKVIWTSSTRCYGYLVHEIKGKPKLVPHKRDNKLIYATFTTGNNIGLLELKNAL